LTYSYDANGNVVGTISKTDLTGGSRREGLGRPGFVYARPQLFLMPPNHVAPCAELRSPRSRRRQDPRAARL